MKQGDVYKTGKNTIVVIKKITEHGTVFGTSYFEDSHRDWQVGETHFLNSGWKLMGTKKSHPEYFL